MQTPLKFKSEGLTSIFHSSDYRREPLNRVVFHILDLQGHHDLTVSPSVYAMKPLNSWKTPWENNVP
jgi:hypothetical protein